MMIDRRLAALRAIGIAAVVMVAATALSGCGGRGFEYAYPERDPTTTGGVRYSDEPPPSTLFSGGLEWDIFGGSKKGGGEAGIGVNSYLWRATLDTISFMPLVSADPFGGVIITDWYSPPETPQERFKMNVYILGRDLRADGLRVAVFRQGHADAGWTDKPVAKDTAANLENKILSRARQLRVVASGE